MLALVSDSATVLPEAMGGRRGARDWKREKPPVGPWVAALAAHLTTMGSLSEKQNGKICCSCR